jgi:hypothetical protein
VFVGEDPAEPCGAIIGLNSLASGDYAECGQPWAAHLIQGHGWLGPANAAGSNDTLCEENGCGRPRLDKVHTGYPVRHTTHAVPQRRPVVPVGVSDIPAVQAWDVYAAQVRDLLVRKAGYGNSWQHQGYMGNIGRVLSKADRLKEMLWRDGTWVGTGGDEDREETESVADTLLDIGPLAAFAVANLQEGNRWGRGE